MYAYSVMNIACHRCGESVCGDRDEVQQSREVETKEREDSAG